MTLEESRDNHRRLLNVYECFAFEASNYTQLPSGAWKSKVGGGGVISDARYQAAARRAGATKPAAGRAKRVAAPAAPVTRTKAVVPNPVDALHAIYEGVVNDPRPNTEVSAQVKAAVDALTPRQVNEAARRITTVGYQHLPAGLRKQALAKYILDRRGMARRPDY